MTGLAAAHPDLRIEQVGDTTIGHALDKVYEDDFAKAEFLSVPVTLAILLVVFGALIAAGVPVLLALSSVAAAMGLSAFASHLVPTDDATGSVILLIGMAVGVDYSLFYLRREREERAKGARGARDLRRRRDVGRAVVVSGITVTIAMAGMFLAGDAIFSSFAVGTILVVSVAVLGSLTVLPALLAKLGRWVDRPRIPFCGGSRRGGAGRGSGRPSCVPSCATRSPLWPLRVAALAALALPALGMTLQSPGIDDMPDSIPEMQTYERVTDVPEQRRGHHRPCEVAGRIGLDAPGRRRRRRRTAARTDGRPLYFATDGVPEDPGVRRGRRGRT